MSLTPVLNMFILGISESHKNVCFGLTTSFVFAFFEDNLFEVDCRMLRTGHGGTKRDVQKLLIIQIH